MPGAHMQKQDSLRLWCFCLILAHPWTTRSAEFTSGSPSGCGEKMCASDPANYKIDLASPLSFSSDLVREVHARGNSWLFLELLFEKLRETFWKISSNLWKTLTAEWRIISSFRNRKSCVYNWDDSLSNNSSLHSSHILAELLARAKRARSGAPWVRKFGKLSIRENLVMT